MRGFSKIKVDERLKKYGYGITILKIFSFYFIFSFFILFIYLFFWRFGETSKNRNEGTF